MCFHSAVVGYWSDFKLRLSNQISCLCVQHTNVVTVFCLPLVCEVVQTLQLSSDRDPLDVVGDLSVCLDGMQVDPETFAAEEQEHGREPQAHVNLIYSTRSSKETV